MRLQRLLLALLTSLAAPVLGGSPELSVIQIFNFSQQPDWAAPWRFEPVQRSTGSGFVVKTSRGKRIMTNAHVVSWARQILVRRYQDPRPFLAQVEFISHDCDLAILTVTSPSFFDNLDALEFGELPKVRSTVITYGYPAGGEEISYTRGVVSRIERQIYSHTSYRQYLAVQTDAAINPGNSGGPVIQEDRAVGVAFQGLQGLENSGFFIPPPVIEHFLLDISDGKFDGVPGIGMLASPIQNTAYRSWLKLPNEDQGLRVDSLAPFCGDKTLQSEDVILKIGSFPVAYDGTILFQGNRVGAAQAFQTVQAGQTLPVQVWRNGRETNLTIELTTCDQDRSSGLQYDVQPRYYCHAGLVFTPLSIDYIRAVGIDPADPNRRELIYELRFRAYEDSANARPEPVVLASLLPHEVNANWAITGRALVDRINGVRIEKLADVVRAIEENKGDYDVFEFMPNQAIETISRAGLRQAQADIMKTYSIPSDRRL